MSTYICAQCGRSCDDNSSEPHECESDRIEREARERDAGIEERLDRIERRQRLLAGAIVCAFGLILDTLHATRLIGLNGTTAKLQAFAHKLSGCESDNLYDPCNEVVKEWEGEI